jgi:hypothetical protein
MGLQRLAVKGQVGAAEPAMTECMA